MAPTAEVAGWASSGKRARCSEKTWWLQVVSVSVPVERGYRVSLCRQEWQEWGQRPKPILVPWRTWKPCGPGMPSRLGFSKIICPRSARTWTSRGRRQRAQRILCHAAPFIHVAVFSSLIQYSCLCQLLLPGVLFLFPPSFVRCTAIPRCCSSLEPFSQAGLAEKAQQSKRHVVQTVALVSAIRCCLPQHPAPPCMDVVGGAGFVVPGRVTT